jgi:hypothetical protein
MKKISDGVSIINWLGCGWNDENAMSCHNLRDVPSMKLWPRPSSFVLDGTDCAVCMNGFQLERELHLGSCEYIYHPMCLISLMVVCKHCVVCKVPFHECLYELFGLAKYMPIS